MTDCPSHLLVTFQGFVGALGRPRLMLLDLATSKARVVRLAPEAVAPEFGLGGVALSEQCFYLAASPSPSRPGGAAPLSELLIFDRRDLTLVGRYQCRSVSAAHSLALRGDRLLIVSTGSDELVELTLRDATVVDERTIWRPEPDGVRADHHHLNAVCWWGDDILVSMLGRRTGDLWATARDGRIVNVMQGSVMVSGLQQPHSLLPLGDEVVYCESQERRVRVLGDDRIQTVPGYARGLARIGDTLFVGTSSRRPVSKSTGLENPISPADELAQRCGVTRLSLGTFEVVETIDLGAYGDDIYDLLPIWDVGGWPLIDEEESERESTQAELRRLTAAVELRDRYIADLRQAVAGYEQTVAGYEQAIGAYTQAITAHEQTLAAHEQAGHQAATSIAGLQAALAASAETTRQALSTVADLQAQLTQRDVTIAALCEDAARPLTQLKRLVHAPLRIAARRIVGPTRS